MESGLEFLDEFLQLGGVDVANRPEALCVPTSNVESLHFVASRPEVPKALPAMKRLITCIRRR